VSRTFHHRTVKRSRRQHECTWCAEGIEVGQPHYSYRWVADGCDAGTVRMHPECYAAMEQAAKDDPWFSWSPGDFARGSTAEPNS
jgi:hypothetical protein